MKTFKIIVSAAMLVLLVAGIVTAQTADGKDLFLDGKCNTCHSISSLEIKGKMDKGPDLSDFGSKEMTNEFLTKYLNKEEKLNEKTHPVKYKGTEEEMTALVTWLNSLKAKAE
ncbi:MAG: hypothetical protein A2X64_09490 [Ignavibacteria bacterium GWF2_33_9]|nr:MAG: hypothetical protein A2X64_09490 [Ignavibacteria bacterium GWF2_33_9]